MKKAFPPLFILLCFSFIILFQSCKGKDTKAESTMSPVRVSVLVAGENGDSSGMNLYSGTVSSSSTTLLSFPVAGTLKSLLVNEGDPVVKGKIVATLSAGDYENAVNIAAAQLAEARDAYDRFKKLHDANALPDIKWVEIQQKLKQAENAEEMARRTLSDATLRSPVDGKVSRKFASMGQNVMPGEPIVEIVSVGDLTIDITVPENEIGGFSEGMRADISFNDVSLPVLEGKVKQKSVVADPLTRGYTVKVTLPSNDGKIMPGMIGSVKFPPVASDTSSTMGFSVPSQAVLLDSDNSHFVWIIKDGVAYRKLVTVDELVDNGVLITGGIERGDSIIVEGMRKVGTGTPVKVITKK